MEPPRNPPVLPELDGLQGPYIHLKRRTFKLGVLYGEGGSIVLLLNRPVLSTGFELTGKKISETKDKLIVSKLK